MTSGPDVRTSPSLRRVLRPMVVLFALGLAVHVLLPQVDEARKTVSSLGHANWVFVVPGVVFAALTFVGAAVSLQAATSRRLPFRRTVEANLAGAFLGRIAPANLGSLGVIGAYLYRAGATVTESTAAIGLNAVAGAAVHLALLAAAAALVGQFPHPHLALPSHFAVIVVVAGVLAAVGLALAAWGTSHRKGWAGTMQVLLDGVRDGRRELRGAVRDPRRGARLVGGALLITVAQIGAFGVSVAAFDGHPGVVTVMFVYLAGAAVSAASPTPGGLGAMEAALVSGLTLFGVAAGPAVAGVLLYRLLTFWAPIAPGALAVRDLRHHGML